MGSRKNKDTEESKQDDKQSKKDKKVRKRKKKALKESLKHVKNEDNELNGENESNQDHKPSKKKVRTISTCSIAVPGSILDNAQTIELRTYLAGQIARAACVFKVSEIVVYDDQGGGAGPADSSSDKKPVRSCCEQLAMILQFLECPQYLRKHFFPFNKNLRFAGLLNPLDCPHHLRINEEFPYREGVTVMAEEATESCVVNCGLEKNVTVDKNLPPGFRVTVKLESRASKKKVRGKIVSPSAPSIDTGTYWGYSVRIAQSLSAVFSESPYSAGYDLTIGTSERGDNVDTLRKKELPEYHHVLIAFGGLKGLEAALESDEVLNVDDPALLFDQYLNVCPGQGSRIIRTEEAILITLAELRTKLTPKYFVDK